LTNKDAKKPLQILFKMPQMMVTAYEQIYLVAKANNNSVKSLAAHEK
jgi:hypothetical protein